MESHTVVLQSRGLVELSSSEKCYAYATFGLCKKYLFGPGVYVDTVFTKIYIL